MVAINANGLLPINPVASLFLLSQIVLVFGYLALTDMRQTIVFLVLGEVEAHALALCTHAHGDDLVDKPVAQITHGKRIDDDDGHGKQMVKEDHHASPLARDEAFLDEDAREHCAEDTARAVGGEYVEGIVDAAVAAPVDSDIAYQCDDKGDEDALSYGDVACRWGDGHQTYHATHGGAHGRRLAPAQTVKEYPGHHRRCRGCIGIEKRLDCLAVGMQRTACIEAEPSQPQHSCSQQYKGDVGRLRLARLGSPSAQEDGSREGCHSR